MEDHLILAIKNLTAREKSALHKKISHQRQKQKLFQSIEEKNTTDNKVLSEELNYSSGFTGLYTLKNRLFDDIIEVKLDIKKNPLVLTSEKIHNLRNLVYDKDSVYLLREIKRLEKNAESFELFDGLKELYFCMLLTFRHDKKKAEYYKKLMDIYEYKQKQTNQLEQIFYIHLLDTPQDLFYSYSETRIKAVSTYLKEIENLYINLKSKASYFLYKSAYLTIKLNSANTSIDATGLEKELDELLSVYSNSYLPYKYPYCQIAIQCLYSKYYFLTNNKVKFNEVHGYISSHIEEVEGYGMFDCSYFYYLYASVLSSIKDKDYNKIFDLLEANGLDDKIEYKTDKMKVYYLYLIAIKFYYAKDYDKCFISLMKARKYFSQATENTAWVCVENILLSIVMNIKFMDFNFIYSELDLLRRVVKKTNLDHIYTSLILNISKEVKQYEINKNINNLIELLISVKREQKVFNLVDLSIFK